MNGTEISDILCRLYRTLANNNKNDNSLQYSMLDQLKSVSDPETIMALIAPNLFVGPSEDFSLTKQESLQLLIFLASNDPDNYLKPASTAIKNFVSRPLPLQNTTQSWTLDDPLLNLMVSQLSTATDIQVSSNATETLIACCQRCPSSIPSALQILHITWESLWRNSHNHDINNQKNHSLLATTHCVRTAHAITELWCLPGNTTTDPFSLNCLLVMLTNGWMDSTSTTTTSPPDPLLLMSVLDLLERLATALPQQRTKAHWLTSPSLLKPLGVLVGASTGEPDPMLGSAALRILSRLAVLVSQDALPPQRQEQEQEQRLHDDDNDGTKLESGNLWNWFPSVLRNFPGSGEMNRLGLIDAISNFASASQDTLTLVLDDPILQERWLSLSVAQPELKAVVLFSLAHVIKAIVPLEQGAANHNNTSNENGRTVTFSAQLLPKLYWTLGQCNGNRESTTSILLNLAKSPIISSRLASYAVLEAWLERGGPVAAQVLLSHDDHVLDWIMSRSSETTKEGKEAKYALVVALWNNPVKPLLAVNIVQALERYISEGPFHVPTQRWEVELA